jgi:CHASE2 domain-containing sensor protein
LQLWAKGLRYWLTALVVCILAVTGSPYVYRNFKFSELRSKYFNELIALNPRPSEPKFVRLVLIEDKDYWLGEPSGRRPINRRYLAKIVTKLKDANAAVIALDFDMRVPDPKAAKIPDEFRQETQALIDAIKQAAAHGTKVVLSTPIWRDHGSFIVDWDIYQASGLCKHDVTRSNDGESDPIQNNITCGYIAVPDDPLVVPLQILLADRTKLDSFALAVSRALRPQYVKGFLGRVENSAQYGNFIAHDKFASIETPVSTVLQADWRNDDVRTNAVIVGGNWSTFAYGRGRHIDEHWTPDGWTIGAELQANFVENILDTRTYGVYLGWLLRGSEYFLSALAAILFALVGRFWLKLLAVLSLSAAMLTIQWLVLSLFGVFFDAFIPIAGLGVHALYERFVGEMPKARLPLESPHP